MTASTAIPWDHDVHPSMTWIKKQMPMSDPFLHYETHYPNLLEVGDDLLLSVAIIDHAGVYTYEEHMLYLIDPLDGSYQELDPGLRDEVVTTKLVKDPEDDQHLVLAARKKLNADDTMYPISDLIRESMDGGATWQAFTTNTTYAFHFIKDVDIAGGKVYFTRISDWILRTSLSDHEAWDTIGMATVGVERRVAWLAWIEFDMADPDIVYGGLDLEAGFLGLIRSDDDMKTWKAIGGGITSGTPSNLAIHPMNGDIIVTAGNHAHYPHVTRDGGDTWSLLTSGTTMGDEIAFDPHDPDHLILISETTQIMESWDGGLTWDEVATRFTGARIFDIEVSSEGNGMAYASIFGTGISRFGDTDNLDAIIASGEIDHQWDHMYNSPDYAYDILIDPDDPTILYTTYSPKIFEGHSSVWRYDSNVTEASGWTELLRVPGSAGITSIAFAVDDPDTMYAGVTGARGTIYVSHDRGEAWEVLSDDLTFSTIHQMAIDPTDEDTVYAAPWGGGLWRSTDGDQTWEWMEIPTVSVSSIVIDPADGDHIFLGDRTKPNVYETRDGGDTWDAIMVQDIDLYYRVSAMALHGDGLYVSVFNIEGSAIGVYEGPLSGTCFRLTDTGPQKVEGDLQRAVIGFASRDDAMYAVSHIEGVYILSGDQWAEVAGALPDMGFNSVTILADGTVLLAGGCDIGLSGMPRVGDPNIINNVFRSGDGGANWEAMLDDDPFGAPIKGIVQHPTNPDTWVAGTGSGVWVSTDGGGTWSHQSGGLDFLPVGSVVMGTSKVYSGSLGGGVFVGAIDPNGAVTWSPTTGPHPNIFNVLLKCDPTNSSIIYATAYPGGVFKSVDAGQTWTECNFALPSFEVSDPQLQGYYSLEIDPTHPDVLYLGIYGKGIYVSRDGAATWFPIYAMGDVPHEFRTLGVKRVAVDPTDTSMVYIASNIGVHRPIATGGWELINDGLDMVDVISLTIADDGSVYAGTNGYGVYTMEQGGDEWTHMGRPIGFGRWAPWERRLYQYSAVLFDPDVQGTIYLGHFPGGFFVSEDDGRSWRCSTDGLGNDGIFSLTTHPEDHDMLFAGTYNGIWGSHDRGATWFNSSVGMPDEQWPFCVVIDDQNTSVMYTATKNGQNKGFMHRNTFGGIVMKSLDGGETWFPIMDGLRNMSEYYQLIIHPINHSVLFVSSTFGVFISWDAGGSWEPFNAGMPVGDFYIRDNVAENLKISTDGNRLYLAIIGWGVWMVDITELLPE
jgi:photosystem II stability/assembly factor-like uncharacterized protein